MSRSVRVANARNKLFQQSTDKTERRAFERRKYSVASKFRFDPYSITTIPGYDQLLQHGMYSHSNRKGMTRDHMISVEYGFRNNIDPAIIAHPANCQFLSMSDNAIKSASSCLTIDELLKRIEQQSFDTIIRSDLQRMEYTEDRKRKVSETLKNKCWINDGIKNKHVFKTEALQDGWSYGKIPSKYTKSGKLRKKRIPMTEEQRKARSHLVKAMWADGRRKR